MTLSDKLISMLHTMPKGPSYEQVQEKVNVNYEKQP